MTDIVSDEDYAMVEFEPNPVAVAEPVAEPVKEPVVYNIKDLIEAINVRDLKAVKWLVETHNVDIHLNNDEALRAAVKNGNYDIVKYLVERGAIVHINDNEALKSCSETGHLNIFKYLIKHGASINDAETFILENAVRRNHVDIIKYMFELGVSVQFNNNLALQVASRNGNLELVKYLVSMGADIHVENDYALRWASEEGHFEVVKYCLEKGADVHAKANDALRSAARKGHLPIVKLLVEHGANIRACNDEAISKAYRHGHNEVVAYLESCKKSTTIDINTSVNIKKELESINKTYDFKINQLDLDVRRVDNKVAENEAHNTLQIEELRKKLAETNAALAECTKLFAGLSKFANVPHQDQYECIKGVHVNLDTVDNYGYTSTDDGNYLEILSHGHMEQIPYDTKKEADTATVKLENLLKAREKYRIAMHLAKQ